MSQSVINIMDRCTDLEAERSVIGSLLIGSPFSAVMAISLAIVETHKWFSDTTYSLIYEHLALEYRSGNPCERDLVLMVGALRDRGVLEKIGGQDTLVEIASSVPSAANLESYCRRVREMYFRRQYLTTLYGASRELSEPMESGFFQEAERWNSKMVSVTMNRGTDSARHISAVLPEIEESERRICKCGITWIDQKVGLARGEYVIIAGRPSMGKSSLANQISTACAKSGHPVLIFSQEMNPVQWSINIAAREAGVNGSNIRRKQVTEEEQKRLSDAEKVLRQIPLHMHSNAVRSIQEVVTETTRKHHANGIDLIVVDYIQNVPSGRNPKGYSSENDELTYVSRELQRLARDLNICVIAVSQLNRGTNEDRGVKTAAPGLARLRGSGSIEQDADVAIFVHRPEYYCHSADCPKE